jgi:hypothetical protein
MGVGSGAALPPKFDFLRPSEAVQADGAVAAALYDSRRTDGPITDTCVQFHIRSALVVF